MVTHLLGELPLEELNALIRGHAVMLDVAKVRKA